VPRGSVQAYFQFVCMRGCVHGEPVHQSQFISIARSSDKGNRRTRWELRSVWRDDYLDLGGSAGREGVGTPLVENCTSCIAGAGCPVGQLGFVRSRLGAPPTLSCLGCLIATVECDLRGVEGSSPHVRVCLFSFSHCCSLLRNIPPRFCLCDQP
jgi:hypothetical protein